MPLSKRAFAEFIGTFWLVFGGCGSAVLAAAFPGLGIGFAGVALAFGLTVLTMAIWLPWLHASEKTDAGTSIVALHSVKLLVGHNTQFEGNGP
jgi:Major intrinsic protein